jgi:uncharacterized protein
MYFPNARILIFAKAPVAGRVKTRLIPALGPQGAADLHKRLLLSTVIRLGAARVAPIELWCAPDPAQDPFPELAARYDEVALYGQRGADLGERMYHAARDALCRCEKVLLVGTDCPSLDAGYLRQALEALKEHDAVLAPAQDGGYVLLGLKRAAGSLFHDMPWGGYRVAAITRDRMAAAGWKWAELPSLWDLDRPDDLERLRPGFLPWHAV